MIECTYLMRSALTLVFTGNNLRERRRETIKFPPNNVEFLPVHPLEEMAPDHKLTGAANVASSRVVKFLVWLVGILRIPNMRFTPVDKLQNADGIYTPGQISLNNFPYVVEVDNVACLTFYRLSTLRSFVGKTILTFFLKKKHCRGVICISEASRQSMIHFFRDSTIEEKCFVVYPYVSDKHLDEKNTDLHTPITCLFISSDFYLKWWRELVEAFSKIHQKFPDTKLTIITKLQSLTPEDLEKYKKIEGVEFVEGNRSKEELYNDFYLKSDIFVVPTYQDSFWLVFLEAVSCGLAVISTKLFAIPEMVEEGENGFLIDTPVKYFTEDFLPDVKWWNTNISEFAREHKEFFAWVEKDLVDSLTKVFENPELLENMKKKSLEIFQKKFSPEVRNGHFKEVLERCFTHTTTK